jgi:hypothetical protein
MRGLLSCRAAYTGWTSSGVLASLRDRRASDPRFHEEVCGDFSRFRADSLDVGAVSAHAVRATLANYIAGDGRGFCSHFTSDVAQHLAAGRNNCQAGVARALAPRPGAATYYAPSELPTGLKISRDSWNGSAARLTSTWPWPDIRRTTELQLEK